MIQISDIKETRRGRFALFAGEEFLFSVDGETLAVSGIKIGSMVDSADLDDLMQKSDTRKAKDSALRYLSLRSYGEQELYKKLCLKHDEQSAAAAVAAMAELGLLDDLAFARGKAAWLASRGKSSREILMKLRETGLDKQLAGQVVEELELDETSLAVKLIYKSHLTKLERGETQKVIKSLAAKGFSYGDIRQAIEQVTQEQQMEQSQENEEFY